jgi:hypothetical protein
MPDCKNAPSCSVPTDSGAFSDVLLRREMLIETAAKQAAVLMYFYTLCAPDHLIVRFLNLSLRNNRLWTPDNRQAIAFLKIYLHLACWDERLGFKIQNPRDGNCDTGLF